MEPQETQGVPPNEGYEELSLWQELPDFEST